ncbi:hypothetical protein KKA00_09740 [bacterium]|nr:hypothetical protein [bacterium]MBU1652492.1 hypothetical protein [bacterium]
MCTASERDTGRTQKFGESDIEAANPITWISYNLPYPQKAEIAVYNLIGQKVATLVSGLQMPGQYRVPWVAEDVSSGVYWVRMVHARDILPAAADFVGSCPGHPADLRG